MRLLNSLEELETLETDKEIRTLLNRFYLIPKFDEYYLALTMEDLLYMIRNIVERERDDVLGRCLFLDSTRKLP